MWDFGLLQRYEFVAASYWISKRGKFEVKRQERKKKFLISDYGYGYGYGIFDQIIWVGSALPTSQHQDILYHAPILKFRLRSKDPTFVIIIIFF